MKKESLYSILGITEDASFEEIKMAFRQRSKETHPDAGGNEDDFKKVNEAYKILSDDEARIAYDITGEVMTPDEEGIYILLIDFVKSIIVESVNQRKSIRIDVLTSSIETTIRNANKQLEDLAEYKRQVKESIKDIKHKRTRTSKVNCFKKAVDVIVNDITNQEHSTKENIERSERLLVLLQSYSNKNERLRLRPGRINWEQGR